MWLRKENSRSYKNLLLLALRSLLDLSLYQNCLWTILEASQENVFFNRVKLSAPRPSHNLEDQASLFVCIITFALTGMVGPAIDLLKPTGHVMHQQFNIRQLYALPTLYLCVLYLSENKQRLVPLTA